MTRTGATGAWATLTSIFDNEWVWRSLAINPSPSTCAPRKKSQKKIRLERRRRNEYNKGGHHAKR